MYRLFFIVIAGVALSIQSFGAANSPTEDLETISGKYKVVEVDNYGVCEDFKVGSISYSYPDLTISFPSQASYGGVYEQIVYEVGTGEILSYTPQGSWRTYDTKYLYRKGRIYSKSRSYTVFTVFKKAFKHSQDHLKIIDGNTLEFFPKQNFNHPDVHSCILKRV